MLLEGNGAPECKVEETIKSVPISSKLVESVTGGEAGKQLLTEFKPLSGSTFSTVHFTGTDCTVKEVGLTGVIAAEVLTDSAAEEKIELGQAPKEAHSWLDRFPEEQIKEVALVNSAGEVKIEKIKLLGFGDAVSITGEALGLLANSKSVPEQINWSPLP